jgi:hypothetical protein
MSLSRRQFVYVASLSMVATAVSPSAFAEAQAEAASTTFSDEAAANLGSLSLRDFESLIGARFSISLDGRSLGKLTLIEAADTKPPKPSHPFHTAGEGVQPARGRALTGFSLRFQGSGGRLTQDTYLMKQPGLGSFPLFIVPEGPSSDRTTYQAFIVRFADQVQNIPSAQTE